MSKQKPEHPIVDPDPPRPGDSPRPDHELPGDRPDRPDHGLPPDGERPPRPDQELPESPTPTPHE